MRLYVHGLEKLNILRNGLTFQLPVWTALAISDYVYFHSFFDP